MILLKRIVNISASHSLKGHPKCGRMHGHNYRITVAISTKNSSPDELIIDFGKLKKIIEEVLKRYDHMHIGRLPEGWNGNKDHIIEVPFELVSSENLAEFWGQEIQKLIPEKLFVNEVEVQETPNNIAVWKLEN